MRPPRHRPARKGGAVVATRDIQTREKCKRPRHILLYISISMLVKTKQGKK